MATGGGSDTRNNSVISSRRQSRNSQSAQYANMELEDLKYELDEKEREINVSIVINSARVQILSTYLKSKEKEAQNPCQFQFSNRYYSTRQLVYYQHNLKSDSFLYTYMNYIHSSLFQDLKHNLFVVKKSSRQQLNNEIGRHKASLKKLDEAMKTIDDLKNIIREKDKLINHTNIYAHRTLAQSLNRARRKSRLGK